MTHLAALILGAMYVLGFAPFDLWPLAFAAIGGMFWLLQQPPANPLLVAYLFGVGKYAVGASWVYVSIHVYGNAPPWLAGSLVVLFVLFLALLFALPVGWLYRAMRDDAAWSLRNVLVFTAAWIAVDWVSTWFLTGFPWLLPGYAVMQTWAGGWIPVLGVLGTGAGVVLSAAALALVIRERRWAWTGMVMAAAVWLGGILVGAATWVQAGSTHSVALVQGNIDQNLKWLREQAVPNIESHVTLSQAHWDADILVWPEGAITLFPQQVQGLLNQLDARGRATSTNVVVGIPDLTVLPGDRYEFRNAAIGLGQASGKFAKIHLVPFGEYVPLESLLRGLIEFFDLPMSSSVPGDVDQENLGLSMGEAAMAICYEVAYPETMRRQAVTAAMLMTISNDTWFGESIGPHQHMQIAQARAKENGRWMLRGTNNGVTAIVDHRGIIKNELPQFEAGVLRGEMTVMQGRTPFSYVGHWPVLVLLVMALAWRLMARRARRS